jgi:O-antigen ligase
LLTAEASADDTAGFASRTFSLPLQILTEQGIVGALAWMFLLSGVAWKLHRRLRDSSVDVAIRAMQATFGAGVAAVLVREFTYSSLFEHGVTLFLFLGMLALTCQDFDSTTPKARAEAPTAVRPGAKMMAEKKTKPRRKARV